MTLLDPIPSTVEECSPDALEWGRLKELVATFAYSSVAVDWLLQLKPSRDPAWIAEEHGLTGEMRLLFEEGAAPSFRGLFDPGRLLEKARTEGAALEPEEMRDLLLLMDSIIAWHSFIERPPEALAARLAGLTLLSRLSPSVQLVSLARSLRSRLNPDGLLADDASPELKRLRKEIDFRQRKIAESLQHALNRLSAGGEAQEDLITIRGERFVIPVKSEFKRRIPGVVHGVSSSGQTVYLEPLETIEQNNELVRLLEEEQLETRRIFEAMTREVGLQAEAILEGAKVLAKLDTLGARAAFAADFDCVRPQFADPTDPVFALDAARHPLLEHRLRAAVNGGQSSKIVPLTLALDSRQKQLIVSGPNTGGKTVVLKTAGLLSMMAQAGIPVPAASAVFPVFDAFLADIGDAQSIERGLSSFSAHIGNIDRISQLAEPSSLVLLDELGSATDPEEGAALAVAIAGYFLERGALCLISTHLTSLKVYAAKRAGVLNAAVGFNEQTLEPTYELRLGVPGASAGINIAQRLGLNPSIVEQARTQLNVQTMDIGHFLDQLHAQLDAASGERENLRLRGQELALEKARLDAEGLKEWRARVRDLERQLQSLLKEFAYQARESISGIEDRAVQQKLSKDAERRVARLRREFTDQFNAAVVAQHSGADKGDRHARPHMVGGISPGTTIKLKSLGQNARVLRQLDEDTFEASVGAMKMRVRREDIAGVVDAKETVISTPVLAAQQRGVSVSLAHQPETLSSEINVIGRTVEEAAAEVDQFLDRAFLAGMPQIRIVHGVGAGVLRKNLRALLERHPHVAKVGEAGQSEGGAGATIVELKG